MAQYIADHYTPQSKREGKDCTCSWAKKALRDLDRSVRRVAKLFNFYLDDNDRVKKAHCIIRARKQNKKSPRTMVYKCGFKVPQSVKYAINLDKTNGNTMWRDVMALEVDSLKEIECFDFRGAGDRPAGNY
eukprot:5357682-Ditylum_brightwellii.AAC.1